MIRRAALVAAATLALAACAEPPTGGPEVAAAPAPATRFEAGGGEVREVDLTGDLAERTRGVWVGAFRPYDPGAERYTGPVAGTARLTLEPRGETQAAGRMEWRPVEGALPPQEATGALTVTGHVMLFNAHFVAFEQDGVTFLEADMMAPDGRFHRLRLVRQEAA
ncbi:MAG: hypothetical protein R6V44_18880 [Paracoccaceae bacterium]